MENKSNRYKKLIEWVKDEYTKRNDKNSEYPLNWYSECKEINLWTYWQGLGYAENTPNIDILLVGQDWGNPYIDKTPDTIKNIKRINEEGLPASKAVKYLFGVDMGRRDEQTDKNLITLFKSIGYEDIENIRYEKLFFTNYSLGYRKKGSMSGGMTVSRLLKDKEFFIELVNILQPKVIICLGQIAYEAVLETYGKSYNNATKFVDQVKEHKNTEVLDIGNRNATVFGVSHCGYFGTINRGDIPSTRMKEGNLDNQIKDWEIIKEYLIR